MALTLTAKPLASAVANTDYIAAIVDPNTGASKVFASVLYTPSTSAPSGFTSGVPANSPMVGIPQLTGLTQVVATDPATGDQILGQLKVTLTPNASDTENASSPMQYVFSGEAFAITATSAS